jgi:hypothetical protein
MTAKSSNFRLHYAAHYPGANNRAELLPLPRASHHGSGITIKTNSFHIEINPNFLQFVAMVIGFAG